MADIVKTLLAHRADVNAKDNEGKTALFTAAGKGAAQVVRVLLDVGADVSGKRNDGLTALMNAAMYGATDIVKVLLEKGADVNARTNDKSGNVSALNLASRAQKADIVQLLINAGARQ